MSDEANQMAGSGCTPGVRVSAEGLVAIDEAVPRPITDADFATWVRPHLPAMTHLAGRLVAAADRDDVVQDALTRAWRRRSTYDEKRGTPRAWLLAIVAGEAKRRRWRRTSRELPDVAVDMDARDVDLERALRSLTDRQRLAIDCYYFAALSVTECAKVMRCSEGTVKSTLSDARTKLRSLLETTDE